MGAGGIGRTNKKALLSSFVESEGPLSLLISFSQRVERDRSDIYIIRCRGWGKGEIAPNGILLLSSPTSTVDIVWIPTFELKGITSRVNMKS